MAEKNEAKPTPAAKLTNATCANVSRNVLGTEKTSDGTVKPKKITSGTLKGQNVTKDGQDHGATATVAHMRTASDAADFAKAWEEFQAVVSAIETGKPIALVGSNGQETIATPKNEYVDGKRVVIYGKKIYPTSFAQLAEYINAAIDAATATSITAFNNQFKTGYGGTASATALDDNADLA